MRNRVLLLALLACATGTSAFAQQGASNGGHGALHWMLDIPDWLDKLLHYGDPPPPLNYTPGEIRWDVKCEGGFVVFYGYYHTYPGVHGFDPSVGRNPTNIPCDPDESTDKNGGPAANANSAASSQGSSGSSGGSGGGPPPKFRARAHVLPQPSAAPGSFALTVPYRELGVVPFSPVKNVNPNVSCNTAVNPTAFLVDHLNAKVTRFNMCTGQTVATINVVSHPLQVRVTPDGSQAIVTSYDNGITFISTTTNQITKVLQPGLLASGLAISADGSYALVTNYDDLNPYLAVVDIASQSVTSQIPLTTEFPQSVFLNPDNTLAWVTFPWDNVIYVIDVLSGTVARQLTIQTPYDVAFSPTGDKAYIASGAGSVEVLDTGTYQTLASVPAGNGACDLQVSPDGHLITVNNYLDGSFTMFDSRSLPFSVTMKEGVKPHGTAPVPIH
ncbi:MAG TPA: YncE family protein [Bryobacteraceae bacterium]|nr:YncE family protein [Bryobacteraceae bacterium]